MQTSTENLQKTEIRQVPPKPCLTITAKGLTMAEVPKFLGIAYQKLFGYASGQTQPGECFARYPSWSENSFDIEAGIVVKEALPLKDDIQPGTLGGHQALFTLHKGSYEGVGAAYETLQKDREAKGLKEAGAPYEIYLNDPSTTAPADLLTEIYWPVE